MIIPITLLFGTLGFFIYKSKKELLPDYDTPLINSKISNESDKDLEDLFI